jgi:hypothetical protein
LAQNPFHPFGVSQKIRSNPHGVYVRGILPEGN